MSEQEEWWQDARENSPDCAYLEVMQDERDDVWDIERGAHLGWLSGIGFALTVAEIIWTHWPSIVNWMRSF